MHEGSVGGEQPSYSEGVGTGELAGPASGRRGGFNIDGLLPDVREVEIARGRSLAVRSREMSRRKISGDVSP